MAKFILDSDVLIWILREREETLSLVERLTRESPEPLACSSMSVLELWVGVRPAEERLIENLFAQLTTIPVGSSIAQRAASFIRLQKRFDPSEWIDAIIAATALQFDMTLVTYNRHDYPYPEISLYPA